MAGPRKFVPNPDQIPLLTPDSSWKPPSELPDLRGQKRLISIDCETKDDGIAAKIGAGWAYKQGYITGISMAWGGERGEDLQSIYASLRHPESPNLDPEQVARWVQDHLNDPGTTFVAQNGGYDYSWMLADLGIKPPPGERMEDTQAAAVMVDENRLSYKLDDLCKWRGVPGKDERLLKEAAAAYGTDPKGGLWRMPARYVGPYAEQDAVATLLLIRSLWQTMREEETFGAYRTEVELIPMVAEMRRRGVRLDTDRAIRTRDELFRRRDEVLHNLSYRMGRKIELQHIDSPRHMEQMFNEHQIPFERTEKSGQGSFKNDWMKKSEHWLPKMCAEVSRLHMAGEKFVQGFLLDFAHKGRLHAEVHQFRSDDGGTVSHRFSYGNPPLQQMPSRDPEIMPLIRGLFLPEDGCLWGAHDYCHDDQTEVLTERGWVLFKDLGAEKVAQWHKDGRVEFVTPTDRYVGEAKPRSMVKVKGTRQIDFVVTEDHRCLRKRPADAGYSDCLASDFDRMSDWVLPQAGMATGDATEDADLIRLIVAIQADAADRGDWVFYLRKQRKIDRLKLLLDNLGLVYKEKYYEAKGEQWQIVVRDTDPRIRQYLRDGKVFVAERLLSLTPALRRVFIEELQYWDGKKAVNACKNPGISYGSVVESNVDTVQAMASITGSRATKYLYLKPGKQPFHHVTISKTSGTWCTKHTKVERVDYTGKVYCLTVPSSYLITRRAGHVLVSGNSQQEYRLMVHFGAMMAASKVEDAVAKYWADPKTDFHSLVAELTGLERKRAKDVNFATAFGAGVNKFALMTGMDLETAKATMDQYNVQMPFIRELGQRCQSLAERRGWVKLIDGARSHFEMWELSWRDRGESYEAPRNRAAALEKWPGKNLRRAYVHKAMNRLIQGSGARQMKQAMLQCWREGLVPMLQVHDELSFSHFEERTGNRVAEIMRDIIELKIPSAVDSEYGPTWGTAAKVELKGPDGEKIVPYRASWDEAVRLRDEGPWWNKKAA